MSDVDLIETPIRLYRRVPLTTFLLVPLVVVIPVAAWLWLFAQVVWR